MAILVDSQIFPTPVYLAPPMKGFPWNGVMELGLKTTRMMGATRLRKKCDNSFSHVNTIHECDRWTDRWTDTSQRL